MGFLRNQTPPKTSNLPNMICLSTKRDIMCGSEQSTMRQGTLKVRYRKIRFASERRVVLFYRLGITPNFSSQLDTYSSPDFYR